MPIFFQHIIDDSTRIGIWKIEETETFFSGSVPIHKNVSHPVKRLQHLAGRFLLKYLFPDFPHELIKIADTRKPYLPDVQYHFSISHCGDFAAAIVSKNKRVGIDIEISVQKIEKIKHKFLNEFELESFDLNDETDIQNSKLKIQNLTLLWSCKEAVFKWHGDGGVDFSKHIQLSKNKENPDTFHCLFSKTGDQLLVQHKVFDKIVLSWVMTTI